MLDDEFIQYCELNNIENIEVFAKQVFQRGFTLIKYGDKPNIPMQPQIELKVEPKIEIVRSPSSKDLYDE